ncbi:MAG TPA: molecular chaperone DnaJ, partial [Dehalococcoidia bacterium]|nr:molecular chaperone DnaJ [Dehalococcoidia bacterium]
MTTQKRDYYGVLGVPRTADAETIKRAFRKLAMQYHPDRNAAPEAAERFKEINEAYEVLADGEKRARYDRYGHAGVNGGGAEGFGGFSGFGDIFDAFFGGFGTRRRGPQRGADLKTSIVLEFEEAVFGCEKDVEIERTELCSECRGSGSAVGSQPEECPVCHGVGEVRRTQQSLFGQFVNVSTCDRCRGMGRVVTNPCPQCRGAGRERRRRTLVVKIPGGVDTGSQIRLTGEGDAGALGGSPGNLYITVQVRPHPLFRRDEDDLIYELPVNFAQAALGSEVSVPLIDGSTKLKVPPGTQSGHLFRLRGKGVPHLRGGGRGDMLVVVDVTVPTELSDEQRQLLERLAATLGEEPHKQHGKSGDRSLFDRIRDA